MNDLIARYLKAIDDPRVVERDPDARYFGARLDAHSLVPGANPRLGTTHLTDWIRRR